MRPVQALAVAAIAVFVSACGSASFEERANDVCTKRKETIRAVIEASALVNASTQLEAMIDASATELASLQVLEPPPEQQATYRGLLTSLDEHLRWSHEIRTASARGDSVAVRAAVSRIGVAADQATHAGRMLELSECDWVN
jgi:hypothetical protein